MILMKRLFILFVINLLCALASAQNIGVSPAPQQIESHAGVFRWDSLSLSVDPSYEGTEIFFRQYAELTGMDAVTDSRQPEQPRSITLQKVSALEVPHCPEQAYRIEITPARIEVTATTDQGLFYGWQSVKQLYRYHFRPYFTDNEKVEIPCMTIVDYPALEWRGWMDDISRGPIPTMEFLKKQIEILSEFKLNCFTLYTEHVFKSEQFDFAPDGGITADELCELQEYAKPYHIQLIGNQQCFAHLDKILTQPEYAHLADTKYNLNPALPETYTFLDQLLDEEAQNFTCSLFNINCDETEALGTGAAADYVRQVGSGEAYSRHIVQVHDILEKYGKKTMIWADIVLQDKAISEKLPKDITMIVWSYVPSDDFTQMINPIREAGFDFWVAPGVSMWSTVFPDMASYERNIAHFARDGAQNGARGLLNTAWNDSGEAFLQSAWHAFAWGAEMAWHPMKNTSQQAADKERAHRLAVIDTCFNFQFFNFYNDENIVADFLRAMSHFSESDMPELYTTGKLWHYNPLQFLAANLTPDRLQEIREERFALTRTIQLEKLLLSESAQFERPEIIFCATHAGNRMFLDAMLRRFQFYLYDYEQDPGRIISSDIEQTEYDIQDLTYLIEGTRDDFLAFWDNQYRPYWRDVNEAKYNDLLQLVQETRQHVLIRTSIEETRQYLQLKTILGGYDIHYTLDGSTPTEQSPVYKEPILIEQSCTVRTLTIGKNGHKVYDSQHLLVHKGIGHWTNVEGNCSQYRPEYSGSGKITLSDGELGSDDYRDGKWCGYQGQDVVIHYSFGSETDIQNISIHYLQNFNDWILAPEEVVVSYGDGVTKKTKTLPVFHFDVEQVSGNRVGELELKDLNIRCEELSVRIKNPGPLPPPHAGGGSPSYIFIDEVIIH